MPELAPAMRWKFQFSIRQRLMLIVMGTSAVAIVFAGIAYVLSSLAMNWQNVVRTTTSIARITGENCEAALAFHIPQDAENILLSLNARPSVIRAILQTADGQPFASYTRTAGVEQVPPIMKGSSSYDHGTLWVTHAVVKSGRFLGVIHLQDDLSIVTGALRRDVLILLIVTVLALLAAYAIARGLVPVITKPIQRLTETARAVSEQQVGHVRAGDQDQDEIALLTGSFNEMLVALREREDALRKANAALESAQDDLERKVKQRTAELARSNRDLEQFAYIASHDLQEPLRTVKSFTQLLARRYQGNLDADADKYIGFAVDGADRMQALIQDLLTYSRVGRADTDFVPADLNGVLTTVLQDQAAAVKESSAVVTHDTLPNVRVNARLIGMVLQNLIANAIKFRGSEVPRVHVGAARGHGEWVISVRDNGIGIEVRHFDRLFQVFQRLHTRREYPGTGIGLAVCRKIVERHGGRIWVESEPGKGSIFRFSLPDQSAGGLPSGFTETKTEAGEKHT